MDDNTESGEEYEVHTPDLFEAVQRFVNCHRETPVIVQGAILVYETVRFEGEHTMRSVDYALLNDMGLAMGRGLLEIGIDNIKYDLHGMFRNDEDED